MQNEPIEVTLKVTGVLEKLGVLKTRAGELDLNYMQTWAKELKVSDLLQRALKESA